MKIRKIFIRNLLEGIGKIDLHLQLIAGNNGLDKQITVGDINRPGLSLTGFFDFFAFERIQIFGQGETAFLRQLSDKRKKDIYETSPGVKISEGRRIIYYIKIA